MKRTTEYYMNVYSVHIRTRTTRHACMHACNIQQRLFGMQRWPVKCQLSPSSLRCNDFGIKGRIIGHNEGCLPFECSPYCSTYFFHDSLGSPIENFIQLAAPFSNLLCDIINLDDEYVSIRDGSHDPRDHHHFLTLLSQHEYYSRSLSTLQNILGQDRYHSEEHYLACRELRRKRSNLHSETTDNEPVTNIATATVVSSMAAGVIA
ncbi:hypothetical protein G4B88_029912 [Cannabis sativa]|uniref:Uncharacterized protein n=1 Tax=Cannabis sativa TaxID=3483 RepID=A0A7J6DNM7_CANSA|nr:hypothetical protein G4B88_029912 [Cannabis sativa]